MLVPNINSIHEITPPGLFGKLYNRQLPPEEQIYFRTRGVSFPEKLQHDREKEALSLTCDPKEYREKCTELDHDLARKKFVSLHNYFTLAEDGTPRQITDFDDFLKNAAPEMVIWYLDVITSGEKLSAAERRNFLQRSVSPSGSQQGETATTGIAESATLTQDQPAIATM